jgi:4'-phosphopantetheinyl transferase
MPAEPPSTFPVEVWFARIREPCDPSVLEATRGRLEAWEEERLRRLRRTEDQIRFAVAHILVRVLLSALRPVPPTEWRLAQTPNGRPFVSSPRTDAVVHFNLSHTAGLVGCAAAVGVPVGFDVEAVDRRFQVERLARRILSPAEYLFGKEDAGPWSPRWVLRYWTLKEALLKAVGLGLRLSPRSVEVSLRNVDVSLQNADLSPDAGGPAAIEYLSEAFGDARDWRAYTLEPLDTHVAAVAARAGTPLDVRWRVLEVDEVLEAFV